MGGLKFASEDHVLHDYFATFGKIKEAVVIRDRKTGLSKGYGFVSNFDNRYFDSLCRWLGQGVNN